MQAMTKFWGISLAAMMLITGCDRMPGAGPTTLVVNLATVAVVTGQDQAMQTQAQAAREEMNVQLAEAAGNLERQIEAERANIVDLPIQEQEQQLQQMTIQARQRYSQLQAEAEQQAQQFELNLVAEFREQVKPFAEKIARSRGAEIILLLDDTVLWLKPGIDLTDEIIAAVRAAGVFAETDAGQVPGALVPAQ